MSMGSSACFAEVIELKTVKKFCPDQLKNFLDDVEDSGSDLSEVARNLDLDFDEVAPHVVISFKQLQKEFEDKTGLQLYIGYHDKENEGDKYDEVDGVVWSVCGVYELTPSGKKMIKYISRKFWTHFG